MRFKKSLSWNKKFKKKNRLHADKNVYEIAQYTLQNLTEKKKLTTNGQRW